MQYSLIGMLALILHLIINHDFYFGKDRYSPYALKEYNRYLNVAFVYYIVDILWGIFDEFDLTILLYVDTVLYHGMVILSVLSLCFYFISYLKLDPIASRIIKGFATFICAAGFLALFVNLFFPVFFSFNTSGDYQVWWARYLALIVQIIMYTSIIVQVIYKVRNVSAVMKKRYYTISIFSVIMIVSLIAQSYFPTQPCYTIGLLIGTVLLHSFIQEDEKKEMTMHLAENEKKLKEITDVISASDMGVWSITLIDGKAPRMKAEAKMKENLGIEPGCDMSEEEVYEHWYSRIDKNAIDSVNESVRIMMSGKRHENTYKWWHPVLGERFVRCGGTAVKIEDGYLLSGYHYDVTEQKKAEIRSSRIINSFAKSYSFINYMNLNKGTYVTYKGKTIAQKTIARMLNEGNIDESMDFAFRKLIAEDFRDEVRRFADIGTINERMRNCEHIEEQFKALDGLWYEWSYVVSDRNEDGSIKHLLWAVRKIDDEKRLELHRQKMLEDNIAANKAKTLFLQNMSHEIRTPLNAMFGFAQLLGLPDGSWSEDEKMEYNRFIHNSYTMLDMLIGDIIDIADSEHDNYHINISDVYVNNVCRNSVMSVDYRKRGGVNLYYTSEVDEDFTIKSDGRRIQQVMINYLTNACKHTDKGEIHLHCSITEHPGKVTFSVADTGTGVPASKADIIFERFTKLDSFTQGSGLGLNICQMIATKLGGEVYLDKTYTGGARFVFVVDCIQ